MQFYLLYHKLEKDIKLKTTFLVAGYQAFDLSLFNEQDPRISIIRKAIRKYLIRLLDEGVEWFVFMGNLGFEYWVLEEAQRLQSEGYDCSLATLFCFATHGQTWHDKNQDKLARFKAVDFVKYCYESYDNPSQLRDYQRFLLANTQGVFLFYEPDHPAKLSYLYDKIKELPDYDCYRLTFDELNEMGEEY